MNKLPHMVHAPVMVARYTGPEGEDFLPMSLPELERARRNAISVLKSFPFASGSYFLIASMVEESVHFDPLLHALNDEGHVVCFADSSYFDAVRVAALSRQFNLFGIIGINGAVLKGLTDLGVDFRTVFSGKVVWARPDAYDQLRNVDGIVLRRFIELGPAVAMGCHAGGGAHISSLEWDAREEGGEIVLSSRLSRCLEFKNYKTGFKAQIDHRVCACGSSDPRLVFPS